MTDRPTRWTRAFRARRPTGSRTRRLLELHLAVIVLAGIVSMTALLVSYREVQNAAGEMRTHAAPAVQGVAATQLALLRAHQEAQASVDSGIDEVVGAGARYEAQLSAANQGLSRLSDVQIDGERGRGVLKTVTGVLTSYSGSITPGTVKYVDDNLMQRQKMSEAKRLLDRPGTGVVPRLDVLQHHQMRRMSRISSLGPLQATGWAVAELGLLVLALTTLSALWLLRRRCGRSLDAWLLPALLVALALAVVPLWATVGTQERLDTARHELVRIEQRADRHADLAEDQSYVTRTSTALHGRLEAERWQSWTYYGALGGGALIILLPVAGLSRRLNADYYWRAG
ncbi:hypothetical protein P8A18_24980 [Streptomyces castrisilvae]|uniref:Integral membrane protein n=1 Tax=Streptomyces castrisilvae TaxID=3033811 RepID=A0ABY9HPK8_9ACTN|nr:hypothetical protein [Streptomyces sp. Mut1]WLQ36482.1 hypothetical protein P8A18_24980 [Streptomyces sp. Mut1]